jgi:hypothetical protein
VKLPYAERVVIARKLRDYVLSPEHPVGRFKAAFFSTLGFTPGTWEELARELRNLVLQNTSELSDRTALAGSTSFAVELRGRQGDPWRSSPSGSSSMMSRYHDS